MKHGLYAFMRGVAAVLACLTVLLCGPARLSGAVPADAAAPRQGLVASEAAVPSATLLKGKLVLRDAKGNPVVGGWPASEAILVATLANGSLVYIEVEADGSFVLETGYTAAVRVKVTPPAGLELPAGEDGVYQLEPGGAAHEILLEDNIAPGGIIRFYRADGQLAQGRIDPATARLTIFEETKAASVWEILAADDGSKVRSGTGTGITLTTLAAGNYLLQFTITDAAGNTALVERNFVIF